MLHPHALRPLSLLLRTPLSSDSLHLPCLVARPPGGGGWSCSPHPRRVSVLHPGHLTPLAVKTVGEAAVCAWGQAFATAPPRWHAALSLLLPNGEKSVPEVSKPPCSMAPYHSSQNGLRHFCQGTWSEIGHSPFPILLPPLLTVLPCPVICTQIFIPGCSASEKWE